MLASQAGGPSDVLEPGVNGWFFRPNDAADLRAKLRCWWGVMRCEARE